ncbi:hypothetical protein AJ80_01666 [Polytolypa hystricis UAMH7299]|uniref:GDP/GTP exchange factor Sec2 N-terminal domain-containing protein n=1 Tax=Polytolypa hystricis (strain UAMH7299) TaxID=1447883 RepID=A0A2B7YZY1_POLH7|nr:hypothetical protein AJ80_01666 [Polytolypa hystricis UAMH7299]
MSLRLISLHGWSYPAIRASSTSSDPQKKRTVSSSLSTPTPPKSLFKAKSTNALSDMAAVAGPLRVPTSVLEGPSEHSLSTLQDPRIASTSDLSKTLSAAHHPDLSNEVAALSDKLIQAINNQTILDDTLAATRQQLDVSRSRVREVEQEIYDHRNDVAQGVLVKKADMDAELMKLSEALAEERSRRTVVEKEKKGIEQELENLTAALFEEANKMVAAAKMEREAVERRNEQLRSQINDTEMLLASQQEQLTELKLVMQQMNSDRDDNTETRTNPSTVPSSPRDVHQHDNISRLLGAMNLSPVTPGSGDVSPAHSTSFSHLIKSVCRTDIPAYEDFRSLIHLAKSSKPPSRAASGSYGSLNVMSLSGLSSQAQHNYSGSNGSTLSLAATSHSSPNGTPSSPREAASSSAPLKETRFYKRAVVEDIEPTLRLDLAPGISWLARRSVVSSICDGGLVVEPMPAITIKYALPCSLCGERRQGPENARTHRFRTSDSDSAQRYPLCMLCLEKIRSCCEFVGYLRMIMDGHVRIGDDEEEKEAWEETIRLRERMFWSRIGGGVVPAFIQSKGCDKASSLHALKSRCGNENSNSLPVQELSPLAAESPSLNGKLQGAEDPFVSNVKRASIGNVVLSRKEMITSCTVIESNGSEANGNLPKDIAYMDTDTQPNSEFGAALNRSLSPTSPELPPPRPLTPSRNSRNSTGSETKLTVTIPGSFE